MPVHNCRAGDDPVRSVAALAPFVSPPRGWIRRSACRDADPVIFFSQDSGDVVEALLMCRTCPVRLHCLEYAMAAGEAHGIWGGATAEHRRRLARTDPTLRCTDVSDDLQEVG